MTTTEWDYEKGMWMVPAPLPPPIPNRLAPLAAEVWVASCVTVSSEISAAPAVTPISGGRMGIFNRPTAAMVDKLTPTIIAVCPTEAEARAKADAHQAAHRETCEGYDVTRHEIG